MRIRGVANETSNQPPARWRPGWKRWVLLAGLALTALAALAYGAARLEFSRFVESENLRKALGQKTGVVLDANAGYQPLKAAGLTIASGGLVAHGNRSSALSQLEARGLTARCNLDALWRRVFRVDEFRVEHLQAAYGEAAAERYVRPELRALPATEIPADLASPVRVEIGRTLIEQGDVSWGKMQDEVGYLLGVKAVCTTMGHGVEVRGQGGRFGQAGLPDWNIQSFRAQYDQPDLHLVDAKLTQREPGGGGLGLSGSIRFQGANPLDLALDFDRCDISPFLPKSWRGKFGGRLSGRTGVHKELATKSPLELHGALDLADGTLRGVSVLGKIAEATHRSEFRRLPLSAIHADYRYKEGKLTVSRFLAESKGNACVEGAFTIEGDRIDGDFQLGTTAAILEAIPGARERVFTRAHDGYLWTSLTLEGPLDDPREDLKDRLIKAAEEQIARKLLAPVLVPGQEVLKLLRDL